MAHIAPISVQTMELYVRRFCLRKDRRQMIYTHRKYAPLVDFADLDWAATKGSKIHVSAEAQPIERLTSAHFNLIQRDAKGLTHLFVWFPPYNRLESDEARLMQRAGVVVTYG
jgi:hypothetical protein